MTTKQNDKDKCYYLVICLSVFLVFNISVFFFVKNTTHNFYIQNKVLDKNIIEEQRRLAIARSNFNKKYNINSLQELANQYLKLKYSTIKQVKNFDDIVAKK